MGENGAKAQSYEGKKKILAKSRKLPRPMSKESKIPKYNDELRDLSVENIDWRDLLGKGLSAYDIAKMCGFPLPNVHKSKSESSEEFARRCITLWTCEHKEKWERIVDIRRRAQNKLASDKNRRERKEIFQLLTDHFQLGGKCPVPVLRDKLKDFLKLSRDFEVFVGESANQRNSELETQLSNLIAENQNLKVALKVDGNRKMSCLETEVHSAQEKLIDLEKKLKESEEKREHLKRLVNTLQNSVDKYL